MSDKAKKHKNDDKEQDRVDEESEDSFPASDPPSFNPGHTGDPKPEGGRKTPVKDKK